MISSNFFKTIIKVIVIAYLLFLGVEIILLNSAKKRSFDQKRFINLREFNPNMAQKATTKRPKFIVDNEGFIEPSKIHTKPDVEIVFLGGSTTACLVVPDSLRFPYLVGRLVETETLLKINSYNGGRSGNDAIDSYLRLLNIVVKKKPDYAVLMHNINDVITLLYTGSYWSDLNENRLKVSSFDRFKNNRFANYSYRSKNILFPNSWSAFQKLFKKTKPADEWKNIREIPLKIDTTQLYQDFESSLKSFIHTCNAWNIQPVLMTQQNRISTDDNSAVNEQAGLKIKIENRTSLQNFQTIYSKANTIIREVSEKNQIMLIDLDQTIPKKKEYILDAVHLSAKGSSLVAKVISDSLSKHISVAQQIKN